MNEIQQRCKMQLELERQTLEYRLQQPILVSEIGGFDPVSQQLWYRARAQLQDINRALQRLNSHEFGVCQKCRQSIHADRLLALPTAELCVDCQKQSEHKFPQRLPSFGAA